MGKMNFDRLFRMKSNTTQPRQGHIIVSLPILMDMYFGRSVVLLVDYYAGEGTFGLIMNKPTNFMVNEVMDGLPNFDARVYIGGPVERDRLFFLHTVGDRIAHSSKVMDGLYCGGDIESLSQLMRDGEIQPHEIRFFMGYSGWSRGQLEQELSENAWLVSPVTAEVLFTTCPDNMWEASVRRMGKKYQHWRYFPLNIEDN